MTYEQALTKKNSKSPEGKLAFVCKNILPLTVGAIGPKLVFEAAMKRGLTYKELLKCSLEAIEDMQWE